jgi:hypothetical protein
MDRRRIVMNRFHPSLTLSLSLCTASACASGTEGRIVPVTIAVQSEAEPERALGSFETRTGWEVTLDRAELALSAIYAFAPAREEPSVMARLSRAIVPVARAHGGHDPLTGKRVRAELVEPLLVDLLEDGRRELAEIQAEAGSVDAVAVDIAAPGSPVTDDLDGNQAWVEGEAQRGDVRVRFAGGVQVPDEGLVRRVEAKLERAGSGLDAGDTVVLGLRPSVWLDNAEFDRLEAGDGDEPSVIAQDGQVGRAWFVGVRSPAALPMQLVHEENAHD